MASAGPADAATPSANVAMPVDYWQSCSLDATGMACYDAALADINYARSLEGVPPMVLPAHFAALDPATQVFVVTNLERVDRGLRPMIGLTSDLDPLAATAAANMTDPVFTGSAVGPMAATFWTGIWANTPNALISDLLWMYQDGWGGSDTTNVDCTAADSAGCWGHRNNILSDYAGSDEVVAGVGWTATWAQSVAEVAVSGNGDLPPLVYTWKQALDDGAGGPTALAAWQRLTAQTAQAAAPADQLPSPVHHAKRKHHKRRHQAHRMRSHDVRKA